MSPRRIQRKRTKGWKWPDCSCGCGGKARYVGRPTIWGNPYVVGTTASIQHAGGSQAITLWPQNAVNLYRLWITNARMTDFPNIPERLKWSELAGHDLMCWCPLDAPCHADVLLELANGARS